jgi:PAS domain S-box-containing protein
LSYRPHKSEPSDTFTLTFESLPEWRLRDVLEAIPGVVYIKDRGGRMIMANRETADLIGRPHDDFIGKTDAEFLKDKAQARSIMETDERIMASGEREVVEEDVSLPDGRPAVWLSTKTPLFDAAGEVVGLIGTSVDFTEQRKAHDFLARSREDMRTERDRLVQMYEQAPGLIAMLEGPEHIITLTNPAYTALIGHREVVGKPARKALPEIEGQGFFELLDQVYQTGRPYIGQSSLVKLQPLKDGPLEDRYLDFVYQPITGLDGAVTGIFFQGTDVTERAEAEATLREREEQLRLATDAADIGLWDVDEINKRLFWQPRVKALFGIFSDEVVTMKDFYNGLHPEDAAMVTSAYAAATDPNIRAAYDVEYRTIGREDGVVRWVAAKGKGRFDSEGRCLRVIGTAIDISARKHFEAEILRLNENLEKEVQLRTAALITTEEQLRQAQKMEAIGQLTGGIAHDFNNLLAGISGSLELLEKRLSQQKLADLPKYIEAAQSAARRATALTQRLLAFSRRQTLDPKAVDFNHLILDMTDLIQRSVGPSIQLEISAAPERWNCLVDPSQLENALLNLCINARDAMPDGGELKIAISNETIQPEAAGKLEMAPGDYVILRVSDTGQGMPPDVARRVFEPFYTTKPLGQGTGLGLSMIYGFVQQSRGQINISSTVGRGTTIRIYLPRHVGPAAPDHETAHLSIPHPSETNSMIMVIDDEPTVRMTILDSLHDAGFGAIDAADGAEALDLMRSTKVDLLVTDVGLPGGLNGRQVADAARTLQPDLKVLFITGYAENAVMERSHRDVSMHIITKPFPVDALIAAVQSPLAATAIPQLPERN